MNRYQFLSSNAQDFIEESTSTHRKSIWTRFLSSNAQDFIEDAWFEAAHPRAHQFLSSNAQDFIEEVSVAQKVRYFEEIPEQ